MTRIWAQAILNHSASPNNRMAMSSRVTSKCSAISVKMPASVPSRRDMLRYRDVMFAMLGGGQAQMTAGLSTDTVAEDLERFSEICPRDIAGKPHRVRTSSRT
jgi:hypothetical protein